MNAVECGVAGTTFRMIVSNEWERSRVETLATKEPETVRWIAENFRAGDTLFDIGANVGIFAILAAVRNPRGTVVAVEPMAATFARLCENAQLNQLPNLRPYCIAIAAECGLGTMHLTSLEAASSMHSVGTSSIFDETIVLQTGIGLTTIDTLAAAAGIPSLMKIDVDGGEDAVLAGTAAVLRDPRLRSILVEFNWIEGSAQEHRRDEPLLRAGFAFVDAGVIHERDSVRWQNTIYARR